MLFTEARKREVVSTSTATRVGRVDGFVVAAAPARVSMLKLAKVAGDGNLLAWEEVQGFGPDAVTIADAGLIRPPSNQEEERASSKELDVLGARTLTERGNELGEIIDVDFDPETGAVNALITKDDKIAGERMIAIGSYAVVVTS